MNRRYITLLLLSCSLPATSQIDNSIEDWITDIYDISASGTSDSELYEYFVERSTHPSDLNAVTREDLSTLYILTGDEIEKIMAYRKRYGKFTSVFELQNIDELNYASIQKLKPFIKVSARKPASDWNGYGLVRFDRILEEQQGYKNKTFGGSPERILAKVRISDNSKFKFGLVAEKDAGEKINWRPENRYYGFDHIAGFASYSGNGFLKQIVVGDFVTLWGQGLVTGGGFFLGKGRESILTVKRNQTQFQPFSSTTEVGFFRGTAVVIAPGKFIISAFYSSKSIDARIDTTGEILSISSSGYHRTDLELTKRKKVNSRVIGINLSLPVNNSLKLGSSFLINNMNRGFTNPSGSYNYYGLRGNNSYAGGVNLEYRKHNLVIFGESAYSSSGGTAHIAGTIISLSHTVDGIFLFRNYSRDYNNKFAAQAFRESSSANNEKGTYWGMKITPLDKLTITAFADLFTFPWLTYNTKSPSYGSDIMMNASWVQSKFSARAYVRFRSKEKSIKLPTSKSYQTHLLNRTQINIDSKLNVTENIALRISVWYSRSKQSGQNSSGNLIYQDILFKYPKISITGRFALIDSRTHENTFYVYEPDLLYSFSVPSYSGNAIKYFILFKRNITRNLSIWAKWSRISYYDREKIGTGIASIDGPRKTEIKAQIIAKF